MEKVKINISIVLPDIADERDACVERLIAILQKHKGLNKVHVVQGNNNAPAQLCFHYEPNIISLSEIQKLTTAAGAQVTSHYGHLLVESKAFRDIIEAKAIENELKQVKGLEEVSVAATGHIRIEFDQTVTDKQTVLDAIKQAGVRPESIQKTTGKHHHEHEGEDEHDHKHGGDDNSLKTYLPVMASFVLLLTGIAFDEWLTPAFFKGWVRFAWYIAAYLPVGLPVIGKGIRLVVKGDVFTEFILMSIATIGAFYIGEYPEGVAVMLFYTVGEIFQDLAVNRAKRSIKALLDVRPDKAYVVNGDNVIETSPQDVKPGDIIRVKPGEKVPLDGEMLTQSSTFNTAALTGESQPVTITKGGQVLAGMINQEKATELKVTKLFNDSSLARILFMVQEATTRKAQTEQFIRKFSRIYTPVVVALAVCITLLPYFFVTDYVLNDWLYRALVFLVISCPCALVISIPLGYFGGIGAASRNGILFKGSNFLDLMTRVNTVVMDKTGTLTKGVFKVQEVVSYDFSENEWLPIAAALEAQSGHPIAKAVVAYVGEKTNGIRVDNLEEISGHGLKAIINGRQVWAGNARLMEKAGIAIDDKITAVTDTIVIVGIGNQLAGYITIADELKDDSINAIEQLHKKNIKTVMLSGDKQSVVDKIAKALGIDAAYGGLLPENKVEKVEELKRDKIRVIAFVGDGINDAPVLAVSDVGMAMGGLGSDAAIETADVVIQTDQPSKIAQAIKIAKTTNRIVWQNIAFAFGVKIIVLVLGAGGIATMWEAVFADVGVALLAILNAIRIQKMKYTL